MSAIDRATAMDLYRVMRTIRAFEERATQLFGENKVWGTLHRYAGEEAIAAGVCAHLHDDDWITSTHRGHGHCIAKGADLGKMFAELLGRETGYCRGRGGSMHIADTSKGNLGANGIVGGGIPIATGAALTAKQLGTDQVAVSFFGDGAVNQGAFHESANLASIWKLPVIYVCENNQYAESLPVKNAFAVEDISRRAEGYGMPGVRVNGRDVRAVHEAAGTLIARARRGEGPDPERGDARDVLQRGARRRAAPRDGARRARDRAGRGHRRARGRLPGHRGTARQVRTDAHPPDADQRARDRRRGGWRRTDRSAAGGGAHVRRLLRSRDGSACEPGGAEPVHVRRPGAGADGHAHAGRIGSGKRGPAFQVGG